MNNESFHQYLATLSINELRMTKVFVQRQLNQRLETSDSTFDKFVSNHPDYINDGFADEILAEGKKFLTDENMDAEKPITVWYGDKPYKYNGHKEHLANPIVPGSAVEKGLKIVNADMEESLDGCWAAIYPSKKCHINPHADNEHAIDQTSPICNISVGAKRTSVYNVKTKSGRKSTTATWKTALKNKSLHIMHAGCQEKLLHSVPPGNESDEDGPRVVFSYRKSSENKSTSSGPSTPVSKNSPVNTLIVGTSMTRKLDTKRLAKKGNVCVNISHGGGTINDIKQELIKYKSSDNSLIMQKVILSVGTNDIQKVKSIDELEKPLNDLIKITKDNYPSAEVYLQNLIPIRLQRYYCKNNEALVNNIYAYNRLLFKLCKENNLYYIDVFKEFISTGRPGFRDIKDDLFERKSNVHLSNKGVAILARKFMYIINRETLDFHPTRF